MPIDADSALITASKATMESIEMNMDDNDEIEIDLLHVLLLDIN